MVRQSFIAAVACVALVSSALAQGGGGAGGGGAGAGSSGAGGASSSSGSASSGTSGTGGLSPAGGRSGAPVATSKNPTFSGQGTSAPTMVTSGNRSGATTTNPSIVGQRAALNPTPPAEAQVLRQTEFPLAIRAPEKAHQKIPGRSILIKPASGGLLLLERPTSVTTLPRYGSYTREFNLSLPVDVSYKTVIGTPFARSRPKAALCGAAVSG